MRRKSTPMRGQVAMVGPVGPLPPGLSVRRIAPHDGPALGHLMADAYRGTVDDRGEDEAWHCGQAEATLEGHFGAVVWEAGFVAFDTDGVAGTSLVTDEGSHLLLAFALVAPRWQRRGLGGSLLARSAHALIGIGAQEWTLAVTDGNPARNLYERLGFVADESLRGARSAHPE